MLRSDTARAAADHNRRGIRLASHGEQEQALAEFQVALDLNGSIENNRDMAVNLLNSARIQRLSGNFSAAEKKIEQALSLVPTSAEGFSECAFEKARISQRTGRLEEARAWAQKSLDSSPAETLGSRLNLVARLDLQKGELPAAERFAEEALLLNRQYGLKEEEANSYRLLGDIRVERDRAAAIEAYEKALEIDKEIGRSGKIGNDLMGLAVVFLRGGEEKKALEYYRRCQKVMLRGGDLKGAAAVMELIAAVYEKNGGVDEAKKMRNERETLLLKLSSNR